LPQRPGWSPRKPRRNAASQCPMERLGDWWGANEDTIGVRLREKYERAVGRAVAKVEKEQGDGAETGELIRAVAADRHLLPDEHDRKSYREIARRTDAPYAKVIQTDRLLQMEIRRGLENDPEYVELKKLAGTEPRGVDTPAGEALDQQLARIGAAEILQRLLDTSGELRHCLVDRLLGIAPTSLLESIRRELESLPVESREQLHAPFSIQQKEESIEKAEKKDAPLEFEASC
jgi:hypothetical protein